MKTPAIGYRLKFSLILFLLSIVFKLTGQEVIEKDGVYHYIHTQNEIPLKNMDMPASGSKQDWPAKHLIPVEKQQAGSWSTKSDKEWSIQRVHIGKFFDHMGDRSLALDADGNPHIAYGGKHLYYAWYDGTEWHIEIADESWDVRMCASIALDSDGYPHISYYDRDPHGDLKYAYKDANGWHITTADNNYWVGLYTSIALDASNHPHISYMDGENGNLKYAYWNGSQWNLQVVDSEGVVGVWRTSLAMDQNDFPHISYFDYSNGNLKYAHWDGSDWQIVTLDNDDDVGGHSSIALDENGYPHISYLDYGNARLKYACWDGSEWQHEVLDAGENPPTGRFNSIALDADGRPHIGYSASGAILKYAFFDGANWVVNRLTPLHFLHPFVSYEASEGIFASLALDANGHPHISHTGRNYQSWPGSQRFGLRYNRYDGSEWKRDVVDYELYFDQTSLAVDNANHPHIGYIKSDHAMGYARWDGGQWWHHEALRPGNNIVYRHGSSGGFLALDSNQAPHMIIQARRSFISSHMPNYPSLFYVWYDGSTWQKEYLFYNAWNSRRDIVSSSITLDATDHPHICFYGLYGGAYTSPSAYVFRYMLRENNDWAWSNIETTSGAGEDHSFVIDGDGLPQVSYRTNYSFRYARMEDGQWNKQIIGGSDTGYQSSIKTDANNIPHISFHDGTSESLKYIRGNATQWTMQTVDDSGVVGYDSSLAFDSNGFPHISYFDITNENLKYAYWDGSQWQIETVDAYRRVGWYTSLALDAFDNPHISYYDASFGDLKYATKKTSETSLVSLASAGGQKLNVYPNPASNELWVEFSHQGNEQLVIVLQNLQGQIVRQVAVNQTGSICVNMPVHNLASGIYLLNIKGTAGYLPEKVIVKN